MELSPTARVILGMLGLGPMCGYEIKRFVDHSTRFFWAASYGQIYPELRNLSEAGLIEGRADRDQSRKRIEFSRTDQGREALRRWLGVPSRSGDARRGPAQGLLLGLRRSRGHRRDTAREARPPSHGRRRAAGDRLGKPAQPESSTHVALRFGIACNGSPPTGASARPPATRRRPRGGPPDDDQARSLADRRARRILIFAGVLFVLGGAFGAGVASRLDPYGADDPQTESVIADGRLEPAGFARRAWSCSSDGVDAALGRGPRRVEALADRLGAEPDVAAVSSFASTATPPPSSRATALHLPRRRAASPPTTSEAQDAAERIADSLAGEPGVSVGGAAVAQKQVNAQVEHDLRRAELFAFPLLFLLSLLFFRSLVAAMLPLLVGGLAIVGTLVMLRVASEMTSVSIFALNLVTGLGLGLAIDYSLFIVSRYREEIARSGPGLEALRRTMHTAGRTVLFSSMTVAGALASLLVFPQRFLYSMGIGGSLVALIAAAIALLVLPAILALLGSRVNALSPAFLRRRAERDARPAREGFWYRLSRLVMRFPAGSPPRAPRC